MVHAVEANNVSIVKGSFDPKITESYAPSAIKIGKGTTVTWKNDDSVIHTVTDAITEGEVEFDSGLMQAGAEWSYTFNEKGQYDYYCMLHPWMKGTAYVE